MSENYCYVCGKPAVHLCDGKTDSGTCDRPMCRDHIAKSFPYLACARGRGSIQGTKDYCADCSALLPLSDRARSIAQKRRNQA